MVQTKNNIVLILVILSVVFSFFYFLSPVLTPFLVAAILAYLANPLVEKMSSFKIPRMISVVLVFCILFFILGLCIFLLVPLIQKQIIALIELVPKVITWIETQFIPWLTTNFGMTEQFNLGTLKNTLSENLGKAGGAAAWVVKTVFHSSITLIEWITNILLVPVVTFYLLRDWHGLLKNLQGLLPRKIEPTVVKLFKECDEVLSAFFRGQLLVMIALGAIYATGLSLVGLQLGIVIGMIAGLMSIVPYLGFIVGIVTASIAAFMQFGTMSAVLLAWIVFAIGQVLESTVLTPLLVGDRIGLHPVAVIFAILAGGSLFGFFGILLALPVAAILMVWLRFLHDRYRHSNLYKTKA